MDIDTSSLILNLEATNTPLGYLAPNDFMYETHGTIVSLDESEEETLVGKLRFREMKGTPFMFASTGFRLPTVEERCTD